jgi:hypothetical protein
MDDEELNRQFAEELNGIEDLTVCIEVPGPHAFMVLVALQLALYHPAVIGSTRVVIEAVARGIEGQLAGPPAITEFMRRGWKRNGDECVH